jgi:hypothetical protein
MSAATATATATAAAYKCSCCKREYQRKLYYDKHVLLCELMTTKSLKDMKKDNEEYSDTPTIRVLYETILEMNAKIVKMEAKLEEYAKWAETKKRKINIVDWLNDKYKNNTSYSEWFNNIKISRDHLEMVFQMDYIAGFVSILQTLLPKENEYDLSIKCFDNKDNVLYIFDDGKWDIMSGTIFEKLMITLSKKIVGEFINWQNEHADILQQDEFAIIYAQNMKKIMGGNVSLDILNLRIKKELFKHLKINLKNVMECEFV